MGAPSIHIYVGESSGARTENRRALESRVLFPTSLSVLNGSLFGSNSGCEDDLEAQPESSARRQDSSRLLTEATGRSHTARYARQATPLDRSLLLGFALRRCGRVSRRQRLPACGDPISGVAAKDRKKEKSKIQDRGRPQVLRCRPPELPIQSWKSFACLCALSRLFPSQFSSAYSKLQDPAAARSCLTKRVRKTWNARRANVRSSCAQPSRGRDCHPDGAIRWLDRPRLADKSPWRFRVRRPAAPDRYVSDLKFPALRKYRLPLLRTALRAQASQDVPAMRHHCAHNRFRGIQGVRP